MKRYFDDEKERVTLEIDVDKVGGTYTVEQLNKKFDTELREIDKKEYYNLNKKYENELSTKVKCGIAELEVTEITGTGEATQMNNDAEQIKNIK